MDLEHWITLAERIGFPMVTIILLALGAIRGATWSANNVILPMTRKTIELIQSLRDHVPRNTEALEKIGTQLGQVQRKAEDWRCKAGDHSHTPKDH